MLEGSKGESVDPGTNDQVSKYRSGGLYFGQVGWTGSGSSNTRSMADTSTVLRSQALVHE